VHFVTFKAILYQAKNLHITIVSGNMRPK